MEYMEPELITIIEGPPPEFQISQELWPFSMWEGSTPKSLGVCQMRTFDGQAMIDRCTHAWRQGRPVRLDFPQRDGLRQQVDVLAARADRAPEGDLLLLWVVVPQTERDENTDASLDEDDDFSAFA